MNSKVQYVIKAVLIALSVYFTYRIYNSIMQPIRFNAIERTRRCDVTGQLESLREAQLAYKTENGSFCASLDELVGFIDTGVIHIVERTDSSFMEYDEVYQKDMQREIVVIDTLGVINVKEQLFGSSFNTQSLYYISGTDSTFYMDAGEIEKNGVTVSTFEISAPFSTIYADLAAKYPQEFDKVEDEVLRIGSLTEPTISGNYENTYCKQD